MDDGSVVPTVFSGNSLAAQVGEVVDLMFDTNGGHVWWGRTRNRSSRSTFGSGRITW
jgi:hypothetical protein